MCRITEWFIITRRDKLDFSHAATESVTWFRATFDIPENLVRQPKRSRNIIV